MEALTSPTLRTLGKLIRRYRDAAGLTQAQLVGPLDYSEGWLSNVETAQLRPRREIVEAIEHALSVPTGVLTEVWDQLDGESLPAWVRDWFSEESKAKLLRWFEALIVPGLLQTEAYARAILDQDEAAVAARMERQKILVRDDPPTIHCVIDEAVLHTPIGDSTTMYDQLQHLIESVSSRITVQVVPSSSNPHRMGGFTIATVHGSEVAYVETAVRGIVTSSDDDLARLAEKWESIRTFALSQGESLAFIRKVTEEKWTQPD